jgi:hypothetical protein
MTRPIILHDSACVEIVTHSRDCWLSSARGSAANRRRSEECRPTPCDDDVIVDKKAQTD